ncbi:uncharacterized protein [Physcomitrium patens]|uniref:PPPDE domain-containing protein n=1 Tax=Physcomitrium patens TaxID=3218 RepID=A0A7I4AQD7_PHYPA|nr:uncharacterized protein LOC112291509 [Physcomitrium patens]|eukprot:XP_024394796.1 uncharacterized protein LOC112291509 [Physcomitrella patens]
MAQEGWKVELYVYDLSQGLARQLSSQFLGKVIEGIWHTGVGVYGKEYFFGGGIQSVPLKQSPYGQPVQVAQLGTTEVPQEVFEEYLRDIQPRYTQQTYSLMKHNCNNFSDEVCQFLVGSGIPEYILRLPEEVLSSPMGGLLRPMIENLETTLRNGGVPGAPYQVGSGQAVPNFANVQLPTSLPSPAAPAGSTVPSLPARRVSSVSSSPRSISLADVPPHISPARVSTSPKHTDETSTSEGTEKKGNEDLPTSLPTPAPPAGHDLTNARAKVTQEITQEFALIMASGTFRASEAAALAARRVLERHRMEGVSSGLPSASCPNRVGQFYCSSIGEGLSNEHF